MYLKEICKKLQQKYRQKVTAKFSYLCYIVQNASKTQVISQFSTYFQNMCIRDSYV